MPSSLTVARRPQPVTLMVLIGGALIAAALVVKGWLAATGNFYWDDLILIGRASQPIVSWDYLGHSHDGHFMPAAFLVAGISTILAPVNWIIPALTLIVGQALASLAVWRMIVTIVPARSSAPRQWAALGALAFYLFTPMTVPGFVWWSAALNTLPLQAALAWIVADAIILTRGTDIRHARTIVMRSTIVLIVALAFFEKSLFIVPVACVAAVLASRFPLAESGHAPAEGVSVRGALRSVLARGRWLWASLGVVFVAWTIVFFSVSDAGAGEHTVAQTAKLVWRSINWGVVPALVGGPWDWQRWTPGAPMGFAATWMIVAGWLTLGVLVGWAVWCRRGATTVLVSATAYVVIAQVPVMWHRSSSNTAVELAQTLRYLPDSAVVLALAFALIIASPRRRETAVARRHQPSAADTSTALPLSAIAATAMAALFGASAMIATASYQSSWVDNPTGAYLANAKKSLAQARGTTMFDQSLPLEVLLPVAYPYNQVSATFGRLSDRPAFGDATDRLMVLDPAGNTTAGAVTPQRTFAAGRGSCARPEVSGLARLPLDGPLIQWRWTIALGYCATSSGVVAVSLPGGAAVRAPVTAGLHVLYIQLDGRGDAIDIRPITPGLRLHTGAGRVGQVVDARWFGQ